MFTAHYTVFFNQFRIMFDLGPSRYISRAQETILRQLRRKWDLVKCALVRAQYKLQIRAAENSFAWSQEKDRT